MFSIFFEGDSAALGIGFAVREVVKRSLLNSWFKGVIIRKGKTYNCTLVIRKFGGIQVSNFDNPEDRKEVEDLLMESLTTNTTFRRHWVFRYITKLIVLFFMFYIPVYLITHWAVIASNKQILSLILSAITELGLYITQGLLNRF